MQTRVYNFGAGPSMLPESVLLEVQAELLNWQGLGVSVMEIGHRTRPFVDLMEQLEHDLRELLSVPDDYHVLFLGGAARTQFAMIPMNLLNNTQKGGYLISGTWSEQAYHEACKLKQAYCVASAKDHGFRQLPVYSYDDLEKDTAYLYYTPNETINGVSFNVPPSITAIPLIADMTSSLLTAPINITDFGLIFAGAQKNISIAGLSIVIMRADLLQERTEPLATMLDYKTHINNKSLYATPPTFSCYVAQKMLSWIKGQGGLTALYEINRKKAARLYDYIDSTEFYKNNIEKNARSLVNICFSLAMPQLEEEFVARAALRGLYALKGHKSVGGLRASLYNSMPMAGVELLLSFMQEFADELKGVGAKA